MQDYVITPYLGIGPLKFRMSRVEIHKILGDPLSSKRIRFSDESTDFWNDNVCN
jgi:hypothetical protein